jgi:long-chain acyl-CoA synthetase
MAGALASLYSEKTMRHRNLVELHRAEAERLGPRPSLRFKRHGVYHDITWQAYREQALACAAALAARGIAPGDRVGLLAENSAPWLIADMGIMTAGAVNVPPHAPLSASQIHYQLADAEVRWLFVSTREQLAKVRRIRNDLPALMGVVVFEPDAAGDEALDWTTFLQQGRCALGKLREELSRRESALESDDLATVMYTSGTTGNPKGVMLTHANLLSNALACIEASPAQPDAVQLGWLPLSHIYARTADHYVSLARGTLLCLAESPETVVQNLADVQPTHMSSVPRFYEKLLAAVGSSDPEETGRRLRGVFGPRIEWLGSGGAPLPPAIASAFQGAGLLVLQGYGLTESSPVISFNRKTSYKLDTVGQAIPGVEITTAADGEVLTRGPHVMKGYWKDPAATAQAIRDGWLYTGDLGRIDRDGFLSITGRKKELLVLSNGEKVVPSFLEGLLLADSLIDQAAIYGEGRNFLTALIVPNWEKVRSTLRHTGVNTERPEEALSQDAVVKDLLRGHIDAALAQVANCEQVRKFFLLPRPFTVAGEELTVSLKLRRSAVFKKYRAELEALYSE